MEEKKTSVLYRCIKGIIRLCYPKTRVVGTLPDEPCILVGNHAQMNGPIVAELYCPGPHDTWCAGQMMHLKDVPAYAFQDFWSQKPKWTHPGYKLLSYLIAPLSVCIFNNANTIGVYHDTRIVGTFKTTVKRLQEGRNVVIFPEHDVKYNHIVYEFQDKFISVAKLYYKRTGKAVCFVPIYLAPKRRELHLGEPIRFDPETPIDQERIRICQALMDAVTALAEALPPHTVVPYRNIPRRDYPSSIPKEEPHENPAN